MRTRRTFLSAVAGYAASALAGPAMAQPLARPFVAYDDGLKNGWQDWSWAKVELAVAAGGVRPIKVAGDPWSALALHHDAFSTQGLSKVTFSINGGSKGGQVLLVKAMVDGKPIDSNFRIELKAKTWTMVEVPLKDIGAEGRTIDGICWQAQASPYDAYYITRIEFE